MQARPILLPRPTAGRGSRAGSFGVAVALHLLGLALVLSLHAPPVARPGAAGWTLSLEQDDPGGGGGGAGGESVQMIQLPPPPRPPAPETAPELATAVDVLDQPVELPALSDTLTRREVAPLEVQGRGTIAARDLALGRGPGTGGGSGTGSGTGSGSGSGSGTGPGRGSGAGGDGVRPPAPLTILIPPAATPAVRGKAATVRLQVDSVGVVRDADVVVSSGDRGYDEKLRRIAMGWRFRPARDAANRPVPYPFEISLRF